MSVRSLNGLAGHTNIYVNTLTGQEPLNIISTSNNTASTINLGSLNGYGTAGQVIKVNSTADGLEYANDNDTQYSASVPLKLTGTQFSLDLTLFSTGTQGDFSELDFFLYGKGNTGAFKKLTRADALINLNYNAKSPLNKNNTTFEYELLQSGFTTTDVVQDSDFIPMFDGDGSTFEKVLVSDFKDTINYSATAPLAKDTTNNLYFFDMFNLTNQVAIGNTATFFISNTGLNDAYRKLTFQNLQSSLVSNGILTKGLSFGTDTGTSGTRTLGISTANLDINGSVINNIGTTIAFQVGVNVLGSFADTNLTLDTGTLLRMGNNTIFTNNFSNVWTDCNIQTDKDIHLYSHNQNFANSMNKISFIAGSSQQITGTIGYTGSNISVASGGTPLGASTINAVFMNATGSGANIAFCITPIATDITSKDNKMTINNLTTTSYNPFVLDDYIGTTINTDFVMKINADNILVCDASERRHILIGRGVKNEASYTLQTALTILNNADDQSDSNFYQDARFRIESRVNAQSPVIELLNNSGTNSSTIYANYIFTHTDGSLYFNASSSNNKQQTLINGQNFLTNEKAIFADMSSANANGVYYVYGTDHYSTSTHAWKVDIGGGGDLHFKYNTDATNITQIKGFIDIDNNDVRMNFTGQHRCIPEQQDLYNNVEDYIGMVVESTGQYNSILSEETEEDLELIDNIEELKDIETNTIIREAYTKTETTRIKNQTYTTTNEATINEAQPIIRLTTTAKSKKVYGVISSKEDGNNRIFQNGVFASNLGIRNDDRLFINSLGEGGIKVCNQNGNIENGDLLCSSDIPGIAMKQTEEYVANYTIGKATQDYNFVDSNEKKLIGCVYYCG